MVLLHTSLQLFLSVEPCLVKPLASGKCAQTESIILKSVADTHLSQLGKLRHVKVMVVGSVENEGVAECIICR